LQASHKNPNPKNASTPALQGTVVAAYGKRYQVECQQTGQKVSCVTRGKKTNLACGDLVTFAFTDKNEGIIEAHHERASLLYRSDAFKSKLLAANVTQIIIVLATQPSFYEALLSRCLVAAEAANIRPLIVLNKCDLDDTFGAKDTLKFYADLGYQTLMLHAKNNVDALKPYLEGHASILVGQSGMGKSTIINALLPDQAVRTQEVSTVLDSGKHTTTAANLYHIDQKSTLIDSPGLQEFGLYHLSQHDLELSFVEFRPFLGHCKFNNCKHQQEPECAIKNAVAATKIAPKRLETYQQIQSEISKIFY
jgi:ribosome biogenesis GTPase